MHFFRTFPDKTYTVEDKNLCTIHRNIVVKLPYLRAVWAGQGSILRFVILMEFFLGPWLDVCQFVEISNQMESNGEVTSIERIFLYNATLYKFFCKMFTTSPVGSIWLEMSINWHTTSQGPKKKSIQITKRRIDPCPAHTARNKGSFTTMVLWIVQRHLSWTVYNLNCLHITLKEHYNPNGLL